MSDDFDYNGQYPTAKVQSVAPFGRPAEPTHGQFFKDFEKGVNIVWDDVTKVWRDAASGRPA